GGRARGRGRCAGARGTGVLLRYRPHCDGRAAREGSAACDGRGARARGRPDPDQDQDGRARGRRGRVPVVEGEERGAVGEAGADGGGVLGGGGVAPWGSGPDGTVHPRRTACPTARSPSRHGPGGYSRREEDPRREHGGVTARVISLRLLALRGDRS